MNASLASERTDGGLFESFCLWRQLQKPGAFSKRISISGRVKCRVRLKSREMKSQQSSLRPPGQRSIDSTLLFRASNGISDCKKNGEIKSPHQTGSRVSLSDFLNQKLHRSSVLPASCQGKERPFVSPLGHEKLKGCAEGETGSNKSEDVNLNSVLKLFKHVERDKAVNTKSCGNNEIGSLDAEDLQQTRKRKNLSEGLHDEPSARKRVAVLGEDLKPTRRGKGKWFSNNEEHKPFFNHYANGGGFWDSSMEGVDNEEVGCNEAWEGVGSVTLGGIEWH